MNRKSILALALLSASFTGCVASEAGTEQGAPAAFDDETGAIEGLVTDTELTPRVGAQAGLIKSDTIQTEMLAVTDADGRFLLQRVPPGEHLLAIQALGYQSTAQRVTVNAGEILQVTVALAALPTDEPYSNTVLSKVQLSGVMYKATPECMYFASMIPANTGYNNLAKTCGGVQVTPPGSTACGHCQVHTATDKRFASFNENWTTIVAEMTWKQQTGVSGRGFLFDLNGPNVTRSSGGAIDQKDPRTWYKATNEPPIIHRVDKPTSLEERKIPESDWNNWPDGEGCTAPTVQDMPNCDWFYRVFPAYCDLGTCDGMPDYGIMLDGTADVYLSYFIRAEAPMPWTALPDQ